ncbi:MULTISPECIES: sulfate adenylyltransferase [unclassified Synechococcus]|jgi:sulfate adenylyltransferase|uniref:sulfate adenylyltransferase n=1 Tax=unclassified Synechococcus TaxID=2626047 RepID=UPI000E0ECA05|nr:MULTISPECIES: sulfate adenylyltransferase [unclassified Synechococcus]RZO12696.1 MAG: sulfate adenylyltransferase [Synechococcus sp. MED-G135]|tara:strand:- start:144 stop:1304 length:1161 start_codon:yes stop_codon:yes gene_type:complete
MTASSAPNSVIAPYGGTLVDLMVSDAEQAAVKASATKTLECSDRNACDVELLVVGGFSPERGFMHQADYDSVVASHRTTSGYLFGLPIVMDTDCDDVAVGDRVLLTYKGQDLAVLTVEDKWEPDKVVEAKGCYGTTSIEHPAVRMITMERKRFYLGGLIQGLALPKRVFPCKTPAEVRAGLPSGEDVVAFQCRNPIHRAHYELFTRALHAQNVSENAVVLVHPTCGPTQQDDIPGVVRFQTYERLAAEVDNASIRWAYLPYAMHMAGPREALQHMIIRRNYGCTHFIIGRDMAGCKSSLNGDDFYGPYDAQNFAKECAVELSMETVPSLNLVFTEEEGYVTAEHAETRGLHVKKLSGTQFRKMLRSGEEIPEWFAFKSVVDVLRSA